MPWAGFEPAIPMGKRVLSAPCLPFHHQGFEISLSNFPPGRCRSLRWRVVKLLLEFNIVQVVGLSQQHIATVQEYIGDQEVEARVSLVPIPRDQGVDQDPSQGRGMVAAVPDDHPIPHTRPEPQAGVELDRRTVGRTESGTAHLRPIGELSSPGPPGPLRFRGSL